MFTGNYNQAEKLERGFQLDEYTLLEAVGHGGEAEVWSGWDNRRKRVVALKIAFTPGAASYSTNILTDFEQQAHLIASLEHPHILPLYTFGSSESYTYFAMRYNCMGSLADLLRGGPLSVADTLAITGQICSALAFLHARGVVHRDLKPDNVLLDSQRRVYLSDFGLARELGRETNILHTGRGTEAYASFEQHNRLGMVPQSDIYSLGILVYEMLAGKLPWEGTESLAARQYQGEADIPDLHETNSAVPAAFTAVIRQLTAFHWTERPSTVMDAYQLVAQALLPQAGLHVGAIQSVETLDEEMLSLMDAEHLLRLFLSDWRPNEDEFPARLSHYAYIDAAFSLDRVQVLKQNAQWQQFMLRGALVYDYRLQPWWAALEAGSVRAEVCRQTLMLEEETAVSRAISLWLQEPPSESVDRQTLTRLVALTMNAESWALRQDALALLAQQLPQAEQWQPTMVSESDDEKLAQLAVQDKGQARRIIPLLAQMKSERAIQTILAAEIEEKTQVEILKEIQQTAGSLPAIVPFSLRFKIYSAIFYEQLLEDREGLSLARTMIGLTAGLLVSFLMLAGVFAPANSQMRDVLLTSYPVSDIVTIVAVDDASLAEYGRWDNWSRGLHAQLVEQLVAAGAKAIAFDFLFEAATADDAQLAAAMRAAGNVVQPVLGGGDGYHSDGVMAFQAESLPNANLAAASAGIGHTNILHDDDGLVRQLPMVIEVASGSYPSLALAALQTFLGVDVMEPTSPEAGKLAVIGREIPVGAAGEYDIFYAGPPAQLDNATFTTVSYRDVLAGEIAPELFKDKLVLIGITATAEPDRYLTPVSNGRPMYGVEILANAIESIWSGNFIYRPADIVLVLILLILGIVTGLLCTRPWSGLLFAIGLILFYLLTAFLVFDASHVMLDIFYPVLTIVLSYAMVTAYRYSVEVRRRREIMGLLEMRVAPEVAQATLVGVQKGELDLRGHLQTVTVLAVDLRGFGQQVAHYDPDEVMRMVAYFRDMVSQAILQAEGMIVENGGHRITAVFNAPLAQENHPELAAHTALALQKELKAYHRSFSTYDHPHRHVHFGYGMATGRAIVGYGQSGEGRGYTALGDVVEVAVKLAETAVADQILVGESTRTEIIGRFITELQSPVAIRGRMEPVTVYAILRPIMETIQLA
ncbi:MAG: CHASE2 domain-containing protein [Anaerolineae bacterium]|nr:CHASE2 domain-containing protein [Anaerolineae bacterium]